MRSTFLPLLLGLAIIPACRPAATVPAAAPKAEPGVAFDRLLGLMQSRLVVMHDVARRKWADRSPIEDPGREAALLRDIADRGERPGPRPVRDPRSSSGRRSRPRRSCNAPTSAGGRPSIAGRTPRRPTSPASSGPRIDALNRDLLAELARALPLLQGDGRPRPDSAIGQTGS